MADHRCDTGNFDRTLCAPPCDTMHSYCTTCGERQDECAHDRPMTDPTEALARVLCPVFDHWSITDDIRDWARRHARRILADPGPLLAALHEAGVITGEEWRVTGMDRDYGYDRTSGTYPSHETVEGIAEVRGGTVERRYVTEWRPADA